MGNVSFSNSRLVRKRLLNWWSQSSKYPKLVGFSSAAALGWGMHRIGTDVLTSESVKSNLDRSLNLKATSQCAIAPSAEIFGTGKKLANRPFPSLVAQFNLFTVASCAEEVKADKSNECKVKNEDTCTCPSPPCQCPSSSTLNCGKKKETCSRCTQDKCATCAQIDVKALSKKLGLQQIEWRNSDLSHAFLIRQASQVTVDSVTRMLTEVGTAFEDYHLEYRRVLDTMMDCLEDTRKVGGVDLEVLECRVVLIRNKLDEIKRQITDLDVFFGSLEKLANASAETAFIASAEYASIALSERFQSLSVQVTRLRNETREKERDMLELQALIIVESGKGLK